jgi:hypothetical protein
MLAPCGRPHRTYEKFKESRLVTGEGHCFRVLGSPSGPPLGRWGKGRAKAEPLGPL